MRKQQGWITFQSSEEERQILELPTVSARQAEVLRGTGGVSVNSYPEPRIQQRPQEDSVATEIEFLVENQRLDES